MNLTLKIKRVYQILRMQSKSRSAQLVSQEYEHNVYSKFLLKLSTYNDINLDEVIYGSQKTRFVKVNRFRTMEDKLYNRLKYEMLSNELLGFDEIIEIGGGFGRNLFGLSDLGFKCKFHVVDSSENAIMLGERIKKMKKVDIAFYCQDLTDIKSFDFKVKSDTSKGAILSYQFFEQIPNHVELVIIELLKLFPEHEFVFIESASELFPASFSDLLTRLYIKKQNYQKNIYKVLKSLSEQDVISLQIKRYPCAGKYGHENAVYRFSSVGIMTN